MSHELTTRASGLVEFAFNADHGQAWHGFGQPVPAEHVHNCAEWRTRAGMDWKVSRSRVRYGEGDQQRIMEDSHVLFRSDDKEPLGIVSAGYKIVQPAQVVEFFRDLVEAGDMTLSAMGTLQGGRRFWATARIGETAIVPRDKVGGYVLLSTSADGSLATEARLTTVRVVCANTLRMARGSRAAFKLSHRSTFDPDRVKADMGLNVSAWGEFKRQSMLLANKPVDATQAEKITAEILAGTAQEDACDKVRESSRAYGRILSLFNGEGKGADLDSAHETAWGLLNAFTEYQDHWTPARTDENRFIASTWGAGADMKSDAFEYLLAL